MTDEFVALLLEEPDEFIALLLEELGSANDSESVLAALNRGIQLMSNTEIVSAWSREGFASLIEGRDVLYGPYARMLLDFRIQHYAYVRKET